MKKLTVCSLLLAAAAWAGAVAPFWTLPLTADALEKQSQDAFDQARAQRDRLLAVEGPRTVQNTVENFLGRPFNFKAFQTWLQGK